MLVSRRALQSFGSTADYVVLLHFANGANRRLPEEKLLEVSGPANTVAQNHFLCALENQSVGIKVQYIERWTDLESLNVLQFEMAQMYKVQQPLRPAMQSLTSCCPYTVLRLVLVRVRPSPDAGQ